MKRKISLLMIATLLMVSIVGCGASTTKKEEVTTKVAALKGPTAMGMVKMIDDEESNTENEYEFTIAGSPDELTPKIVNGEIDIAAIPSNLSSILYNKTNGEVVSLGINTLGVLYIVENGENINSIQDLKGKTLYASGKGATPEYALNYILKANGIDPEKDLTIEYKSEHTECLAAISAEAGAIAMLPQPFVTTAITKNPQIRIALDLNEEWEKSTNDSSLVTGVIVARKEFVEKYPEKVSNFLEEYEKSVEFTNTNIDSAAELIEANDIVTAEVAKKAIPYCNITFISGEEMKEKLEGYLNTLLEQNPESIGGAMPSEDFYYSKK
ncbi:hypothetical protein CM240_3236 [Clostridium bornimense]|uniref:Uncharacterized protein n=1 Tax=Clostridium bornimense TaxID=1216932 RepID=W6S0R8_9CLOT|nr:ABC transporter substrate-binding protein [Clostridium bornimense]CDM70353.1 hypothetical protein CM240_3236 [Clostridium bornimense]